MSLIFVKGIFLFTIITFGKKVLLAEEGVVFSGFKLEESNSSICRELPFKKLDEFSFCFFVKLERLENGMFPVGFVKTRIFTLKDTDFFVSLDTEIISTDLNVNGTVTHFQKVLVEDQWTRICLYKKANNLNVQLRINYREAIEISQKRIEDLKNLQKEFDFPGSDDEISSRNDVDSSSRSSFASKDRNVSLCFENELRSFYSSTAISVAAVNISHHFTKDKDDDNCIKTLKKEETIEFSDENFVANNISQLSPNITELCLDTHVLPFINQSGTYDEHVQLCKLMNGRLLYLEEVKQFEEYFKSFKSEMKLNGNSSRYSSLDYFFLSGGAKRTGFLDVCSTYSLRVDNVSKTICSVDLDFAFCICPVLAHFKYHGIFEKYDRTYFLRKDGFSFSLSGSLLSNIEKYNNTWVLSSFRKKGNIELEYSIPMGRQNWTSAKDHSKNILLITHCKDKEFACSNGTCLPWNVRCNGIVECFDKSDEESCAQLEKEKGYLVDLPPPPKRHESSVKIYYSVILLNIGDIMSKGNSIKMEIRLDLSWYDPRIKFWNIVNNEIINIKNIWSPKLEWVGNYFPGFYIEIDDDKSSSSCKSLLYSFQTDQIRKFPNRDPYMGTFIKGEDMKIWYKFISVMDVPCSFNLRRYPFGTQSCNVAVLMRNMKTYHHLEFVNWKNITNTSDVRYAGSEELGEYSFVSAKHQVNNSNVVIVTVHLENLYGFHMLNSFIPSVLICIITYSTLYFPIKDYSDRVMLSLTALLVLAALFTQSSNTSVITPYFKLLDIWYVVLIFFCFMIVIYNILLRKFTSIEEKKARNTLFNANEGNLDDNDCNFKSDNQNQWKKNLVFYNFVAIIFFSSFYTLFIFFFCLAATEII